MNIAEILARASRATNLLREGKALAAEVLENVGQAREVLSETDYEELQDKLMELRAESRALHEAIQAQE